MTATPPNRVALDATERRVLGVLVEKAKTTPDAYPLSLNALRTGCNQKSNRSPQMTLDDDQVDQTTEALRQRGAMSLVQGDSRVERYRHLAYDWFGVEKVELAVLAELLLRGAQTVGELRGRAARMEPIAGVAELTPVLESLVAKGHVEYLSPPGRGAVVSHTFYTQSERERVLRDLGIQPTGRATTPESFAAAPEPAAPESAAPPAESLVTLQTELSEQIANLRDEVASLRAEVQAMQQGS